MKRRLPALHPVSLAACLLFAGAAHALPQGAQPAFGQTTVQQTAAGQLTITQGTARAGIDWASFSIAAGERVRIDQPGANSVLLNRVLGDNPSLIFGHLQSNGSVWLINPRGIVFGANSRVDVGGLVATTLSLKQDDAAGGRADLGRGAGGAGAIVADGQINAAGTVVLAAPQVSVGGSINARRVGIAAATDVTVDVEGDGLVLFNVRNDGTLDSRLSLLGSVRADGGSAELRAAARSGFADTVLNLEGVVQARSLGQRNGRIVIDGGAEGITRLAGTLDAGGRGAGETGGSVQALGAKLLLDTTARIDAGGSAGGGSVRLGGDWHGAALDGGTSQMLVVREGALIDAAAMERGNGGSVVLWSDRATRYFGRISVAGGAAGGDAGAVEVSGKAGLEFAGRVDLAAPRGRAGTLLLDPTDITVSNTSASDPPGTLVDFADAPVSLTIRASDASGPPPLPSLSALLDSAGTVTLRATNNITVSSAVSGSTGALLLEAGNNINVSASITAPAGISLQANRNTDGTAGGPAAGTGRVSVSASLDAGVGALQISNNGGTGTHVLTGGGGPGITFSGGSITITGAAALTGNHTWDSTGASSAAALSGTGSLTKKSGGVLTLSGDGSGYAGAINVQGGTLRTSGNSSPAGTGTIDLSANTTLDITGGTLANAVTAANNAVISSSTGNGTLGSAGTLDLAQAATLKLDGGSGTLTVSRAIPETNGGGAETLSITGGTVLLNAASTVTGAASVGAGTLALGASGSLAGPVSLDNAASVLDVRGNSFARNITVTASGATIASSTGGGTLAGGGATLTLAENVRLNLSGGSGTLTVSRPITETAGGVAETLGITGGTVVLGAASGVTGDTALSGGTLAFSAGGSLAGPVSLGAATSVLDVSGVSFNRDVTVTASGATISAASANGTLAGGGPTLTLGEGVQLNLAGGASSTLTVSRPISETAGGSPETLGITGGTVLLGAASGVTGTTSIGAARLNINGSGSLGGPVTLGNAASVLDLQGATLASNVTVNATGATVSSTTGGGTLSGGTLTLGEGVTATLSGGAGSTLSVGHAIAGTGGGVEENVSIGAGSVVFAGTNTYGGTTVLAASTQLDVGTGGAAGTLGSGAVTIGTGATLRINRDNSASVTLAQAIDGAGTLRKSGNGTVILTGANSYGATTIDAGTLQVGTAGTSGTLGSGTVTNNGVLRENRSDDITLPTVDGSGSVTIDGGGITLVSTASGYGGGTTVTSGTLRVSGTGVAGTGAIAVNNNTLDIVDAAAVANVVTVGATGKIGNSSGVGTLDTNATAIQVSGGNTLALESSGTRLVVARAINDNAGAGAVSTSGTVVLSAANGYSGGTTVTNGTLRVSGATASAGTGTITLGANTLDIAGGASVGNRIDTTGSPAITSTGGGTLANGTLNLADGATLTLSSTGGTLTVDRAIDAAAGASAESVNVAAGSSVLFTRTNTYGGTTVLGNNAQLDIGNGGAAGTLGGGAVTIGTGGTLRINRDNSASVTLAQAIDGAGTLRKSGTGTLILTGSNSYGNTTIDAGTLQIGNNGTSGTLGSGTVTNNGVLRERRTDDISLPAISGSGDLFIDAGGVTTITGAGNYTGDTTLTNGTLRISGSGAAGTGVIFVGNGTLDITDNASVANIVTVGATGTIANSSGVGTLAFNALGVQQGIGTTLALSSTGTRLVVARAIDDGGGNGAVTTSGTVVLAAPNLYTNGTTVTSGTLRISGATANAGSGPITLGANTVLDIASGASVGNAVSTGANATISSSTGGGTLAAGTLTLTDGATLSLAGGTGSTLAVNRAIDAAVGGALESVAVIAGTVVLGSNNSWGGTTAVAGGAQLNVGTGGATGTLGSGNVTLGPGATLRINRDNTSTVTLGQTINGGSATLTQAGTGTTILGADDTLGSVSVLQGTLQLGSGGTTGSVGNNAAVAISGPGTLRVNHSNALTLGPLGGSGALQQAGSGTTTLASANAGYSGAVAVQAGTLQVSGAGNSAGSGTLTLAAGSALDIANGASVVNALSLSGTQVVRSSTGGGTLAASGITSADGTTLQLAGGGGGTLVVSAVIPANAGALAETVQVTGGTVRLTGANAYTGGTSVAGGAVLQLSGSGRPGLPPGAVVLASGSTLDTIGNASFTNAITSNGATLANTSGTGTLGGVVSLAAATTASSTAGGLTLGGGTSGAGSLTKTGTGTVTIGGAAAHSGGTSVQAGTLATNGPNLLPDAGAVSVATSATLALGGGETIGALSGSGTVTLGGGTFTVDTTAGNATFDGTIGGSGAFAKSGNNTLTLTGASTYNGATGVGGGTLQLTGSNRLPTASAITVDSGAVLSLGSTQQAASLSLTGTLSGAGTLTAPSYTFQGGTASANLGAGAITVTGGGTLSGTAAATTLDVNGGIFTVAGDSRLTGAPAATVLASATLQVNGANTVDSLLLRGTLTGIGPLTVNHTATLIGGSVGAPMTAADATSSGSSSFNAAVTAATLDVTGGNLTLGATNLLSDTMAVTVRQNATLTLGGADTVSTLALSGTLTGAGTLTAGTYTLSGGTAVANLGPGTLVSTGDSRLQGTSAATVVRVDGGTLALGGAAAGSGTNLLADTADVSVAAGATLQMNGADTVRTLALNGTAGQVATLAGTGPLTAQTYAFDHGTATAALGTGALNSSGTSRVEAAVGAGNVNVLGGTFTVASAGLLSSSATVVVERNAVLQLTGDNTVGSLDLRGGTLRNLAPGVFNASTLLFNDATVAADLGAAPLAFSGASTLSGHAATPSLTVSSGSLTLVGAGRLTATPATTVAGGATLTLGGDERLGSLAGDGNVATAGATLTTGSRGSSSFGGVIGGTGALVKEGQNTTFTLTGNNTYTGSTTVTDGTLAVSGTLASTTIAVNAGTLQLTAAERLPDTAGVTVAGNATLSVAAAERVRTLSLSGTLDGAGTLTADTTTLTGGRVEAALGGGTLLSSGTSTLNGTAASTTVNVTGGTLALGSGGRFGAAPATTVDTGATLALAGNETLGTLAGNGNVTLGSATLATGSGGDSSFGGVVSGSGALVKRGAGTFTLAGANTYTGGTTVEAGTLALPTAERLADTGALTVARNATLDLAATETVATATLRGRTRGAGTLVAGSYALDGATLDAALGAGSLTSAGDTHLNATSAAGSVAVTDGTLTLGSAARLTGTPTLDLAAAATLALGGNETLATLAGGGTVALGTATLTTGNGSDTTFSGTLGGTGGLTKVGTGTFTLTGASTYTGATTVSAGTLALGAAERLADASAVTVAAPATLQLAGDETVASLLLRGTLSGTGTLVAPTYTLQGGTVLANLGAGSLASTGDSTLTGTAGASTVAVDGGTLALTAADRLADTAAVSVARNATLTLGGNDTVGSLSLLGTLGGTGRLTAATYALNNGTVDADLGAGALTSRNASTINGRAAVNSIDVIDGTLALAAARRLVPTAAGGGVVALAAGDPAPAVNVAGGSTLTLAGDETFGTLAGAGTVALGTARLSTGSGGDSTFSGAMTGSGGLTKEGAGTFTLTGSNTFTGTTRVDAGTLVVGNGATAGRLASADYGVDGTLRFARSDTVTLAEAVSGTGQVEQAGTGTLSLAGSNKTYTGGTLVTRGTLAGANAEALPDAGDVTVAAGARLTLAGAETLRSISAAGDVALGGNVNASGALDFTGAVTSGGALRLSGSSISATNDANRWGGRVDVATAGALQLSAGRENGALRDLALGDVAVGNGGLVQAGRITLGGAMALTGGTLTLEAQARPAIVAPPSGQLGKQTPVLAQIAYREDVVAQTGTGTIDVAPGAGLAVHATQGGSVQLLATGNRFAGTLEATSGTPGSAWSGAIETADVGRGNERVSPQSQVRVEGTDVAIGGRGMEADLVTIRADRVSTAAGSVIVARMPFDNLVGTLNSVPALTLSLTPQAFAINFPFGQAGGGELAINVGSRAFGNRSFPIDGGFITVLPRNGAQGNTAVVLTGPQVTSGGYGFFFEGAGNQAEIPVFYNGVLPITPQVQGSISATLAVGESARRQGFEEAVRTENVAVRLRSGVIAEVGPGRPATVGTEGVKLPRICPPAANTLQCENQP